MVYLRTSVLLLLGLGGAALYFLRSKPNQTSRFSGAFSTVVDGFPEDMNEMPPDTDPNSPLPVVDGSDL